MSLLGEFISILHQNPVISSIIASLAGEEEIMFLAFLSGSERIIPLWIIFISSILGIVVFDHVWYFLGKYKLIQNFWNSKKIAVSHNNFSNSLKGVIGGKYLAKLIVSKFIYGTRIVTLTYASSKLSYKRYLLYDIIAVIIWTSIMVPLAWFAGRGLFISLRMLKGAEKGFVIALIFIILFFLISKLISNRILAKNKKISKKAEAIQN